VFEVPAERYDDYMGRYSRRLAPLFAGFVGVGVGARVLDVGCGPGALTEELARLVGPESVAAADPSASFAAACAARVPGADVRQGSAEALPWADGAFDAACAQLVLAFLDDPGHGVREMVRVVRPGGTVAACTWDMEGGMTMIDLFWEAARGLDPEAPAEGGRTRFGRPTELRALWSSAGLDDIEVAPLVVEAEYADFDDFWRPMIGGVGPVGAYCASLTSERQDAVRDACRRALGDAEGSFTLDARGWAVKGRTPG
jgi:SAM-dependent methyltransferase